MLYPNIGYTPWYRLSRVSPPAKHGRNPPERTMFSSETGGSGGLDVDRPPSMIFAIILQRLYLNITYSAWGALLSYGALAVDYIIPPGANYCAIHHPPRTGPNPYPGSTLVRPRASGGSDVRTLCPSKLYLSCSSVFTLLSAVRPTNITPRPIIHL